MQLRHYAWVMLRWAWLIFLGMCICAGATYIVSKRTPQVYEASAFIQVNSVGTDNSAVFSNQALAVSYALQVTNNDVLQTASDELSGVSVSDLQTSVSASPLNNTQIIEVRADSHDASQSAEIANTVARVFIQKQIAQRSAQIQNIASTLTNELVTAKATADNARAQLSRLENTLAPQDQLERQRDIVNNDQLNYDALLTSYNQLQLQKNMIGNSLIVSQSAVPPSTAKGPRTMINTIVAAIAGLLLTVAFALFLDWQDSTIKTSEDVGQLALLEPLGSMPFSTSSPGASLTNEDVMTQAFVTISTNFRILVGGRRSILVTGLHSGVGISTTASRLAQALTQSGMRVMLIDAHLGRPVQHNTFKFPITSGLTNSLDDIGTRTHPRQPAFILEWLQQWATNVPNLFLLPAGPQGEHVETVQWASKLQLLTERLLQQYKAPSHERASSGIDMIIFDAPALDEGADAIALAPATDGTLLVVEAGKEYAEAIHKAQATLQRLGSPIVGVVVNRQQVKHRPYFYTGRSQQAGVPVESSHVRHEPKYPVLQTREFTSRQVPETPIPLAISQEAEAAFDDTTRLDTVKFQRERVFKPNASPLSSSKNNGSQSSDKQGGQ